MPSDGLTRAERQAQTREKLIATARELFLVEGYAVTSLDRVAEMAGFSKGAVYSNFSGKEELCLAVLDELHQEQIEAIVTAFTLDTDIEGRIAAFTQWVRSDLGQPRWTALEVELAAVARHSSYVASELSRRHQEMLQAATELVRIVVEQTGIELQQSPEDLALTLLSLGIGLGAMRSLNPDLNIEVFAETMRQQFQVAARPVPH